MMGRAEGRGQTEEFDLIKLAEELIGLVGEWLERQRYTKLEAFIRVEAPGGRGGFFEGFSVKLEGFGLKTLLGLAAALDVVSDLSGKARGAFAELLKFFAKTTPASSRDG